MRCLKIHNMGLFRVVLPQRKKEAACMVAMIFNCFASDRNTPDIVLKVAPPSSGVITATAQCP